MASRSAACLFSVFVVYLCVLDVRISSATCTRQYSPPPDDDCSSLNVPCFVESEVGSGGGLSTVQLEHPDNNTRTCYRTCVDDGDITTCEATLTVVHNQALRKDPDQPEFSLQRIFSPNYNDGRRYRKSTICRYNVRCGGGKLLSYNFVAHNLEERSTHCDGSCVDYVQIDLPSLGGEVVTSCGIEAQVGVMNSDGVSAIDVEFVANRHEQDTGFMMFVWCSDPGFDINGQNDLHLSRKKRDEREDHQRLECSQPSDSPRPTVDSAERLMSVIPDSRLDLTSGTAEKVIMNEGDTLSYSGQQIRISRGRFAGEQTGTVEVASSSIRILYVSNRIESRRAFLSSAQGYFQGYGELWISENRAYLLQLGVNPIYRPTDEETEIIMELQVALQEALKDTDYFDVYDELDEEDPEEERGTTPPDSSNTAAPNEALNNKALLYGTACNGLLRSVACAYQANILNRNCITGQMINNSTNTTPTEDPTSEPAETTGPTEETTGPTEETTRPTEETTGPTEDNTSPTSTKSTPPTHSTRTTSQATSSTSSPPPGRGRRALKFLRYISSTIRL